VVAISSHDRRLYGVQFHPEVKHTPFGTDLLKGFLFDVCDCSATWTATHVIEDQVARIRAQVGDGKVLCALSGGVDSAVAALLVHRAVGDRLTCVFVDHGLMRLNEGEQIEQAFGHHFHVPLVHVKAQEHFIGKLAGVTEPEEKRKIIGREFIRVFEREARRLGGVRYLVQGTLYSDVIESGSRDAATIKSHHNVGGLPDDMEVELVEPLRQLFKDEVRVVGEELGLPERMVWRQPFPGPGLAIRIIGDVTDERLDILRRADFVLQEEVRRAGLYRDLWQSFAILPAVRSVGVMGDERTYAYPIVIRAVTSDDAMTADWARLPPDLLERIASRIINEVPGVNRVVLDITSKPPGTIEWEQPGAGPRVAPPQPEAEARALLRAGACQTATPPVCRMSVMEPSAADSSAWRTCALVSRPRVRMRRSARAASASRAAAATATSSTGAFASCRGVEPMRLGAGTLRLCMWCQQ
jgi:GMP synthase (glutamine-hydrolysing)